ncbi:MAG: bifunctional serine/threonine-protein kinase/formylglycine-generating enzyme family protein, partial [Pseudomonadota bacterium]
MKLCPVCTTQNQDTAATCENPDCQYGFDSFMNSPGTKLFEKQVVSFSDGSFIAERYEIVKELGRGGMGVVYLVKDSKLRGREVALKMTHPELVSHGEARQRFEDEVLLCLDLKHENIVTVYPIDEWEGMLYFTMEYIPGQSLRDLMLTRKGTIPPFSLEESIQVVNPLLDALSYAHQTTIHRDIKPENIMIQGEFPDIQVKVLDFGIAKVMSASQFTRTNQSMGTAYYMSPEQMQGAKHIDQRSDLYSVGMVLYELLTAEIAAGRFKLPGELIKGIPESIDILIDKTLSPRPDDRYETALEMKTILIDALQITPEKTQPKPQKEKPAPLVDKKPKPLPVEERPSISGKADSDVNERGFLKKYRLPALVIVILCIAGFWGAFNFFSNGDGTSEKTAGTNTTSRVPKHPANFTNDLGMKLVWIRPGTFTMGSPSSESDRSRDEIQHQVTLAQGYYMMTTEVTQGQWTAVMGSNPSNFKGDNLPVEKVSWNDVQEFIKRLNNKGGKITYRLPTEAEWEYAARAGGSYTYSGSDNIDSVAWYDSNSGSKTHPVGLKTSNAYGLYDMPG